MPDRSAVWIRSATPAEAARRGPHWPAVTAILAELSGMNSRHAGVLHGRGIHPHSARLLHGRRACACTSCMRAIRCWRTCSPCGPGSGALQWKRPRRTKTEFEPQIQGLGRLMERSLLHAGIDDQPLVWSQISVAAMAKAGVSWEVPTTIMPLLRAMSISLPLADRRGTQRPSPRERGGPP